jgi:hypothetical protein
MYLKAEAGVQQPVAHLQRLHPPEFHQQEHKPSGSPAERSHAGCSDCGWGW